MTTALQRLLDQEAPDSDYRRSEAIRAARYFERHFGTPNRPEHASNSTPSVTQVGPVHTVPFASEGNRIALSITGNTNGPVHVSVKKAPPWLELTTQSVALSGADEAADRRAEFTFSVGRAAPATDTATVTFDLTSEDDELLARKQVRVKVQTPTEVALRGNYPNPFRRQTTIGYELPREADVRIEIYDLLGRKVEEIVEPRQKAGYRTVAWTPQSYASGLYLYRLIVKERRGAERHVKQGRMTLVR